MCGIALRLGLNSIEYFRLLRQLSLRHLQSIVFDQMLPKIANYSFPTTPSKR